MGDLFDIEIEPEVRLWLMNLSDVDYERVEHAAERLSESAATLGEPHSRYLGDGVRELHFEIGQNRDAIRISYWLAPGRRVVLLTVFRKTKQRESAEVARAKRAKAVCEAEHDPAHANYNRNIEEGGKPLTSHARWKLARDREIAKGISESPEVVRRREEIRLSWDLGQAVYDRRTELGISQTELARRAGMTQPQISKLELGGTMPTLPLLARLARAMDAALNLELDGDASRVAFTAHTHTHTPAA